VGTAIELRMGHQGRLMEGLLHRDPRAWITRANENALSMRAVTVFLAVIVLILTAAGQAQIKSSHYSRKSDVIYGRRAGLALTMEVFTPTRPNRLGVVWVVSSSGKSSREQTLSPSFEQRVLPFLNHGYTVFALIHGSSPAFNMQDFIDDTRRAVRFVRHGAVSFGIDAERLAIAGSSAGGSIALAVALHSDDGDPSAADAVDRVASRLQAAGAFFAPTDFLHFGSDSQTLLDVLRDRGGADPSFQFYDVDPKTGARTLITDQGRLVRILSEISPVSHVTGDDPPTILIHGTGDQAVPVQQSQRLIDELKAANADARLVMREGMRHAWPGWEADSELIAQWFDSHLRPGSRR
jgi:acetyl esterase/lipase